MISFESDRLSLKELTVENVSANYISWLNDNEINQYLESRFHKHSFADVEKFVKDMSQESSNVLLGIFIKKNMKHIGNIRIGPIDRNHNTASIGLLIGDKDEWGKGYASEAIQSVTKFSFEKLNLIKISASCYESNIGSKKAFEKSGYKIEGFLHNHVETQRGREGCWQLWIDSC
ncbi:MAG: GNAT family N-acetyltransferase [Lentimicrobiaceae bacterium]|jgi:RimJ/RimL family protein N-acetyltransferase|nr:GNAT family N-acetyltransferase [bacterium]MBT6671756.1 GNAT family N-acetyltransferase [Lentimicrobiaceae bacterium]